jgi:predicted MFS family arabinose efflux permease
MAFIGDQVPYEQRQTVLARFLTGTISGIICGQVFGGVLGEAVGWRAVFLLLGGLFLVIGALLAVELRSSRVPPPRLTSSISMASLVEGYAVLLRRPWSRVVLATVCAEAFLFYGGFTFVGAYLHTGFGLNYAQVGILLGLMGLGGLLYALMVRWLVRGLGERGLSLYGGAAIAAGFAAVAISPLLIVAPAMIVLGFGIHMLHNTLQTHATQLAPEARGLAVSTFANVLFMGQAAGVWLAGLAIDRIGFQPVFVGAGMALFVVGGAFALMLGRRAATI